MREPEFDIEDIKEPRTPTVDRRWVLGRTPRGSSAMMLKIDRSDVGEIRY